MLQPETVWQFLSPVARNFVVLLHDSVSSKQYDDNYLLEKIERLTETERGLTVIYMQSLVAQRAAARRVAPRAAHRRRDLERRRLA